MVEDEKPLNGGDVVSFSAPSDLPQRKVVALEFQWREIKVDGSKFLPIARTLDMKIDQDTLK